MAVRADRATSEPQAGLRAEHRDGQVVMLLRCPESESLSPGETVCVWVHPDQARRIRRELAAALEATGEPAE